jgi:hypothetical protein
MSLWDSIKNGPLNPLYPWEREDPQSEANKYLGQIPGIAKQYYNPYISQGQTAGNKLTDQYGNLINDPTGIINKIMAGYSMSPGAKYQSGLLTKGIANTAAAGGFAGTPEAQRQYAQTAGDVTSEDMQQYLQNALGAYGAGLSGESDIYNKGFQASGDLVDALSSVLGSQGGLAFNQGTQSNMDRQALMNAIMKAFSGGAGAYSGGGFQ